MQILTGSKFKKLSKLLLSPMKIFEKIVLISYPLIFLFTYLASSLTIEMATHDLSALHIVILYIATLFPVGYFVIKDIGPQKIQAYIYTMMFSALLLITVISVANNGRLLYYATTGNTVTTTLNITRVAKDLSKGSLVGGEINVDFDNRNIRMYSSRANYFALLDKKSFKADIGKAGDSQYYVSKIYWQPGEQARARNQFWHYWFGHNWFTPIIVMCIGLLVSYLFYKGNRDHPYTNSGPVTTLHMIINTAFKIIRITGAVFAVLLPIYIIVLIVIYSKYGHLG